MFPIIDLDGDPEVEPENMVSVSTVSLELMVPPQKKTPEVLSNVLSLVPPFTMEETHMEVSERDFSIQTPPPGIPFSLCGNY